MNELITNGLHNLQAHLKIMETIFNNTIKPSYNTQKYTFNNKPLLPHQNSLITALWDRESSLRSGTTINGEVMFSKVGIIADPINTGVFETMLSYIKHCKSRPQKHTTIVMHPYSNSNVFSIMPASESTHNCNLIIINNNYLPFLKKILDSQTELTSLIIKRQNQLTEELLHLLPNTDILIVPMTQALNAINYTIEHNYTFHRCFIEDQAALNIIGRPHVQRNNRFDNELRSRELFQPCAEFTWLITEHWSKMIWPDLEFADLEIVLEQMLNEVLPNAPQTMRDYIQFEKLFSHPINHRSLLYRYVTFHPHVNSIIVLSDINAIKESLNITSEQSRVIKYGHDDPLHIVHSLISSTVGDQLHNGNIIGAVQSIGAQILSPEVWSVEKYSYIRQETDEDACPICYEQIAYPTVTECCRKLFCAACIIKSCRVNNVCICPMCRQHLYGNRLITVASLPTPPNYIHPHKIKALISYLELNRNKPTVIYFPFEPRLNKLKACAKLANLQLEILTGTRFDCQRKITQYNANGGILVITDIKQLHGCQLPSTAILILYQDKVAPSIQQILRMHTYGLALPLEVVVFVEDAALTVV
jgi:hypothetical protein